MVLGMGYAVDMVSISNETQNKRDVRTHDKYVALRCMDERANGWKDEQRKSQIDNKQLEKELNAVTVERTDGQTDQWLDEREERAS